MLTIIRRKGIRIEKPNKKPPTGGDKLFAGHRRILLNKNC